MRGLFVTGTDTEAGKSVLAAAICAALAQRGERVAAFKPVVTGLEEPAQDWPRDHELLSSAANTGQSADDISPYLFDPPLSPHLAAELADVEIEPRRLAQHAEAAADRADWIVCEGVGGVMVPLTPGYLVRDLAVDLKLPVVVAARAGLGTINHTLMTVESARAGGLTVAGVAMTPWPDEPERIEQSNRETVERLGNVSVAGLPRTDPESLAKAGQALPLDEWLSHTSAE